MSQSIQVLLALIVGLIIGVVASMTDFSALHTFITLGEPIGVLWVNAIRMTVIPLVVALLVTGIASASPIDAGRIGGKALMWFLVFVAGAALLTAVVAPPLLSLGEFDLDSFATNGVPSTTDQIQLPQFRDWVVELIPSNPIAAAADDAMLPLIVFSVILALAITKIEPAHRERLVGFFDAISKAMLVIVGHCWVDSEDCSDRCIFHGDALSLQCRNRPGIGHGNVSSCVLWFGHSCLTCTLPIDRLIRSCVDEYLCSRLCSRTSCCF